MLISPTGKCYIGRTVNIKVRMAHYRAKSNAGRSPIYTEIGKYGFDSFRTEILEIVEAETIEQLNQKLNERERHFIEAYGTAESGLNRMRYDSNIRVFTMSEETREKMRKSQTGRKHSEESRRKRAGENAYQSKRVKSDKLGKSFASLREAAIYAGISNGCKISEVISGKRKSAGTNPEDGTRIDDWEFE